MVDSNFNCFTITSLKKQNHPVRLPATQTNRKYLALDSCFDVGAALAAIIAAKAAPTDKKITGSLNNYGEPASK